MQNEKGSIFLLKKFTNLFRGGGVKIVVRQWLDINRLFMLHEERKVLSIAERHKCKIT